MTVLVNGESVEVRKGSNLADLIEQYELSPRSVLIEYNGVALHRDEWLTHSLAEGDRIEFVQVVAGG